jgi:hypothetical protein
MVVSSQITFQNYLNAMDQAIERRDLLDRQIADLVREWSLGPVVEHCKRRGNFGISWTSIRFRPPVWVLCHCRARHHA